MSSQTVLATPQAASINTHNVQGDIILGLQKRVEAFLLLTIKDDADSQLKFRQQLKAKLLPLITTTQDVLDAQRKIDDSKRQQQPGQPKKMLPITHINLAFSATGLKKLGLKTQEIPDGAFGLSQKADAVTSLGDPVDTKTQKLSTWSDDFLKNKIDAVFLITAPDQDLLDQKVNEIKKIVEAFVSKQFVRCGNVRPGSEAGHEHFGFLDGVSTPKIEGFNANDADKQAGVVKPSVILVGQADTSQTNPLDASKTWMKDGSFLALRELQQLVPEFQKFCDDTAKKNKITGVTGDFIGARIVGRWKSGAPITLSPMKDDPKLSTAQNFDFADELAQERCPYAAHIRKTNPRRGAAGLDQTTTILPRLMVRNGIPYGPEVSSEEKTEQKSKHNRGLLFVSYQSSLENGFQFVQKNWSNNPAFPPKNPAKVTAGFDLLIGQSSDSAPRIAQNITSNGVAGDTDPNNVVTADRLFIHPLGGEYFFSPSIDALKNKLGA